MLLFLIRFDYLLALDRSICLTKMSINYLILFGVIGPALKLWHEKCCNYFNCTIHTYGEIHTMEAATICLNADRITQFVNFCCCVCAVIL